MRQGEWVELYNNSTESVDLAGWYLRDATDGEGNKTNITALNTAPATTVIGGNNWLVVYMNKAIYNNTGDTVRLFDDSNTLVDSHTYDDPDFCEIEPTPGEENSTDASGSCGGVPPNKSYARIPDGIGEWVDPIPTPGGMNKLEEILEEAPLVEEVVEEIIEVIEELLSEGNAESTPAGEEVAGEEVAATEEIVEEIAEEIVIVEEVIEELPPSDESAEDAPAILEEELEEDEVIEETQ